LPAMRTHEQLLSLGHLLLDGRPIGFSQACLSLRAEGGAFSWSCTLRGSLPEQLGHLAGELLLQAETLDGRHVEGRVLAPQSELQSADASQSLELEGLGPLLIDGREL
jgi:hypothetical protein